MKKNGFTLAEVLITLSILGVIAAITIPSVIRNFQDRITVTNVKRAYALIDTAIQNAIAEHGTIDKWSGESDGAAQILSDYLKVDRYCGSDKGCFSYGKYENGLYCFKPLSGTLTTTYGFWAENNYYGKMILHNGMRMSINKGSIYKNVHYPDIGEDGCMGTIRVDINGQKGPNRWGYDVFQFNFNRNGLLLKCPHEVVAPQVAFFNTSSECSNSQSNGKSCATWILKSGNVDYKYRDITNDW